MKKKYIKPEMERFHFMVEDIMDAVSQVEMGGLTERFDAKESIRIEDDFWEMDDLYIEFL